MRITVTGAGGFIGHHLTKYLKARGHWVRGVDIKRPEFEPTAADEFLLLDLRRRSSALLAVSNVEWVFGLAADMGGMGFIADPINQSSIMYHNTCINQNTLTMAAAVNVQRYFYSSSACIYPVEAQAAVNAAPLREEDAFPANPQHSYGWEKLYMELFCQYSTVPTRVARFHNTYGPLGAWRGGREKAPAALCRKVAEAKRAGRHEVEIWGDGQQTRTFLYVDDLVRGIVALMESDHAEPINLGDDRLVSIDELADMVAAAAGWDIVKVHVPGPQGVRGRNADLSRAEEVLGWQPTVLLEDGLARTYAWIEQQVMAA